MIRITDQYFWNVVFGLFFLLLTIMGAIILDTESRIPFAQLTLTDFTLITLASWRLIRLFVYDNVTKWLREQFYDIQKVGEELYLGEASHRTTSYARRSLFMPLVFWNVVCDIGHVLLPPHTVRILFRPLPRYLSGCFIPPDPRQYDRLASREVEG